MPEDSADRLTPSPQEAQPQPSDPSKRSTLKKLGLLVAAPFAIFGAAKAGEVATNALTQKKTDATPPPTPEPPSVYQQSEEVRKSLERQQRTGQNPGPQVDPTTEAILDEIKASNAADPNMTKAPPSPFAAPQTTSTPKPK